MKHGGVPILTKPAVIALCVLSLCTCTDVLAQTDTSRESDPLVLKNLDHWKDLKFGFMMHWGPYSQWGIVESWSICPEDVDWAPRRFPTYDEHVRRYEQLPRTFNPVHFDPVDWADAAWRAGMRYMVFTTKHHDGFCMFDTRQTSYRVTDTSCAFSGNAKANITKELFSAFRNRGFGIGAYFSKPDWHSPYYWAPQWGRGDRNVNYVIKRHPDLWSKFCAFTRAQIEELVTDYGRIDILWLDGGWVRPLNDLDFHEARPENGYQCSMQSQDIDMPGIAAMARSHQPGLIIVDRAVRGRYENYRTPEKQVPDAPLDYPWETCMTMANQWSYMPGDEYKSTRMLVHMLIDVVAKGGNLLLNVGPTPEGMLPDTALARMREIGEWLSINGEAVYSTRPIAPYKFGRVCFTSGAAGSIYAIQTTDDGSDTPPTQITFIAPFVKDIRSASLMGYDKKVRWKIDGCTMTVEVPKDFRSHPPCRHAWVVAMSGRQ